MAKKVNGLMLEFMPYSQIRNLTSGERVKNLLSLVLKNKIIILQGRLRPEEETRLIEDTMAMIEHVKGFKGIELAVIGSEDSDANVGRKFAQGFTKMIFGDTASMTIIGPASIVKDIKRDPRKIELLLRK